MNVRTSRGTNISDNTLVNNYNIAVAYVVLKRQQMADRHGGRLQGYRSFTTAVSSVNIRLCVDIDDCASKLCMSVTCDTFLILLIVIELIVVNYVPFHSRINSLVCKLVPYFFLHSDINECDSHPCENGATCSDQLDMYNCSCVAGYTGVTCETGMAD